MKKNSIFLAIGMIILVAMSCKTIQPGITPPSPSQEIQLAAKSEKPAVDWLSNYFKSFRLKDLMDSVSFYNSEEIIVNKNNNTQEKTFQQGEINILEGESFYGRVPKMTAGTPVSVEYMSDKVTVKKAIISFDNDDKMYTLPFFLSANGTYILNNDPSLRCKLMVFMNKIKAKPILSTAKGVLKQ